MELPDTPVAERVRRRGPLDDSPAIRQARADVAAEEEDLVRRLKRVREDRAHLDQIAEEEKRKKQRRAMPGGVRAPKGPTDDYGESSDDEEEEAPPAPPPSRRKRDALSSRSDGAEVRARCASRDEDMPQLPPVPTSATCPWRVHRDPTVSDALRRLGSEVDRSMIDRKSCFLSVNWSNEDPKQNCVLEVAVAFSPHPHERFASFLLNGCRITDEATRSHGLDHRILNELKAPGPNAGLSELVEFLTRHAGGEDLLVVGNKGLIEVEVPVLVKTMRECGVDTTLLENARFLNISAVAPDAVFGDKKALDHTPDGLYEALVGGGVPEDAARADRRNQMNCLTLARILERQRLAFDAVAAHSVAVAGLLIEESDDEDEEMAPAPHRSESELPAWPPIPSGARGAINALVAQLDDSKVDRVVLFLDIKASGNDVERDCPVEVAVAVDREDRFSSLLEPTVDPSDAAVRAHGLSADKLRELNAPKPKEAYSRLLEFISEQAAGKGVLFVGREKLCSHAMPMLVKGLRECELPTTLFKEATYLEVAGMVPGEVVGEEKGLVLSRDDLYEALTKERVPAGVSCADYSNFASIVVLACSLEVMESDFDAVAVGARLPDAVPGLLLEEEAPESSEGLAPGLSLKRRDSSFYKGRKKEPNSKWLFADDTDVLAKALGIASCYIGRLAGQTQLKPSKRLVENYEVEKLRTGLRGPGPKRSAEKSRDKAFHARRDGERRTRPGWAKLARNRDAMRHALKRLYSDQILFAKLGRPPSAEESDDWFKEFFSNPPCACNRRAKTCTTLCTTCQECVNKNGGGVFEHTEAREIDIAKLPASLAFLARMAPPGASGTKYLVAWHRPCTQCRKCNLGLVDFVDRSGLCKVAGSEAREKAAEQKADELEKLFKV